MAKKTVRIGIGNSASPKSTLWSITVGNSDVYLAQRFSYELAKISLHNSGKWRFAANSQNWTKPEDRALLKWNRPDPVAEDVVLGPTIVFPPLFAHEPLKLPDRYDKKIHWLSAPAANQERVVMIVFSKGNKMIDDYLKKVGLIPDWSLSLPIKGNSRLNADTVRIISWKENLREFTKDEISKILARMKIHYKKGSDPSSIFGVATPFYPGTAEERARGLSPTVIEIILGKHNVVPERKYNEGMRVRIKSLNIEGYLVRIIGNQWIICNEDIPVDPSINDVFAAVNAIIDKSKSGTVKCQTISGATEDSQDIEIL